MDHTKALPDDVLASILRRLSPRDVAASRGVRRAWLAVVDAHRLVRPHLFPHSVGGLCINYVDYEPSHLFVRPSTQREINLSFLPNYRDGYHTFVDHCNGLLLTWDFLRSLCVVNPTTRRWEYVRWKDKDANPYVVFDPAASPHYEVFSIPRAPEKLVLNTPQKSDLSTSLESSSVEWTPSLWTLNVFSSKTRQWNKRSFIHGGDVAGTMTSLRPDPLESTYMGWRHQRGPRWSYSAYWQGSLYVHCNDDALVVRFSLSDCKYQLIKAPIDTEEHGQFLGKSRNGLYLATIHATCQLRIWSLTDSSGRMDWVLQHDIDLEPLSVVWLRDLQGFYKTWTVADDYDYLRCYFDKEDNDDDEEENNEEVVYEEVDEEEQEEDKCDKEEGVQKQNNEMVPSEGWNSDDDNFLNIEDYDTCYSSITFLGFHPYKEVVFLGLPSFVGVAYHLKSSKVQYLGKMRPKKYDHSPTNGIYESFPYTPCMIGELKHSLEAPCGH